MTDNGEDVQRQLDELKNIFADKLGERLDELEVAGRSLNEAGELSEQMKKLDNLLNIAHKLAGSAGTFGYRALGDLAAEIEDICDNVIAAERALSSTEIIQISEKLADCRKSIEA